MTDYTLSHAASLGEFKAASFIRRIARNWLASWAVIKLENLDDEILCDIGLDRSDVRWAAGLPITIDPWIALKGRQKARYPDSRATRIRDGRGTIKRSSGIDAPFAFLRD